MIVQGNVEKSKRLTGQDLSNADEEENEAKEGQVVPWLDPKVVVLAHFPLGLTQG